MSEPEQPALPFTGERFTPECEREIWYEHWHRYAFARRFATGKRVLDAACGEGYGSALLAEIAADVVGVDISDETVAHARARYGARPRLRFECADAAALTFPDRSFDLVVSFETLEHLAAQAELVAGFARVLADDGMLLISSPDRAIYSEAAGYHNEYHVRELYRDELLALLRPHFHRVRLYGQKLLFQSVLWPLDDVGVNGEAWTMNSKAATLESGLPYAPVYFIALCDNEPDATPVPALSVFGDRDETVYAHYNHEIRKNMQAGARIAELETALHERQHLAASPSMNEPSRLRRWWRRWRGDRGLFR
ncbi:MAG: methyltransferase domain-containing protein [Rhodanobacteraceae bacterium]